MRTLLTLFLTITLTAGLAASTTLIEGFIVSVDNGKVVIEATNHYKKGSTVEKRSWKFHPNDGYVLDNRLVPRATALKPGRKIYIWGKKGGAFFCAVSEAATVVRGAVVNSADGSVTIAVALGDGTTVERAFPLGTATAPAAGTEVALRPARPLTIEAITPEAATAAIPTGDPKLVVVEGFVTTATDTQNIAITDLTGADKTVTIDYRVSRGLLFEACPGKNLQEQLPAGTRVACYGRPKGKKDRFIGAIGPDDGRSEGVITAIDGDTIKLKLEGPKGGSSSITVSSDAVIAIDGESAALADLKPSMRIAAFAARKAATFK